jgi:hypothetical protein
MLATNTSTALTTVVMTETYKIVRRFFDSENFPSKTVKRGLTLEEAQEHCRNPETSSRTATRSAARKRTKRCGMWFDSYEEE